MITKELIQEEQYYFPYHHLTHERDGGLFIFRHLFWGLEHYTYIQFVIDKISQDSFKSFADVGCGEGRILTELTSRLTQVPLFGYDISERALHFARGFTDIPTFKVHDITEKALEEKVDGIVSCEVIEHIKPDHVDSYCKNIADSLNENGLFFITTPTTNVPVNAKHYQHFTKKSLTDHLSPYFLIEEVAFLNRVNLFNKILNRILGNRFFFSNIPILNRWVLRTYNKHLLLVTEHTGSRIYIKARKR
jgi:SAM-dependent methyltransferase